MAEPQYPLFDAIGRAPQRRRNDRWLFLRLGAYLVQVAAIGTCIGMSSAPAVPDANRWLLLGACGLVAVGSGFVLIWPLARVIAEGLSETMDRLRPSALRRLWVAPPVAPEVPPPHPRAPHLRLVWDRSKTTS